MLCVRSTFPKLKTKFKLNAGNKNLLRQIGWNIVKKFQKHGCCKFKKNNFKKYWIAWKIALQFSHTEQVNKRRSLSKLYFQVHLNLRIELHLKQCYEQFKRKKVSQEHRAVSHTIALNFAKLLITSTDRSKCYREKSRKLSDTC